jgi:hypothetical protein
MCRGSLASTNEHEFTEVAKLGVNAVGGKEKRKKKPQH